MNQTILEQMDLEVNELEVWSKGEGCTNYPPMGFIFVENVDKFNVDDLQKDLVTKGFDVDKVFLENNNTNILEMKKADNLIKVVFNRILNGVEIWHFHLSSEYGQECTKAVCEWLNEYN
jgi:hypothetical protein